MSKCRSCKAEIIWAKSIKGTAIPLDAEPNIFGNIVLEGDCAEVLGKEAADKARLAATPLYTSHFATCPNAAQHRKGKGDGPEAA